MTEKQRAAVARSRTKTGKNILELGDAILAAIDADFDAIAKDKDGEPLKGPDNKPESNGQRTIRLLRETNPVQYLRIVGQFRSLSTDAEGAGNTDLNAMLARLNDEEEDERRRRRRAKIQGLESGPV